MTEWVDNVYVLHKNRWYVIHKLLRSEVTTWVYSTPAILLPGHMRCIVHDIFYSGLQINSIPNSGNIWTVYIKTTEVLQFFGGTMTGE
jgi:hypothetical protein